MRTTSILALAFVQALSAQTAARAQDPYAAVNAMRVAFSQVRSVTAVERSSNGDVATIRYNFPNRFRITTAHSQIVLSGSVEYAKRAHGQWAPSPNGPEHQALLAAVWQLAGPPNIDLRKLYSVVADSVRTVGATSVRGFHLHDAMGGNDETIWIGSDNLPVAARIAMPGQIIDIHYTDYNTSTLVATPM
jgi:hypothetical protein